MSVSFNQSASCGSGGVSAGIEGALSGFANIVGLGSLVSGIPGMHDTQNAQTALQDAQSQLGKVTSQWQQAIQNLNEKTQNDKFTLVQSLINASINQQAVLNEVLNDSVQTNTLMISTLSMLVLFLILFDVL